MNEHHMSHGLPPGSVIEMLPDHLGIIGQNLILEMESDRQYGSSDQSIEERVSRLELSVLVMFAIMLRQTP